MLHLHLNLSTFRAVHGIRDTQLDNNWFGYPQMNYQASIEFDKYQGSFSKACSPIKFL